MHFFGSCLNINGTRFLKEFSSAKEWRFVLFKYEFYHHLPGNDLKLKIVNNYNLGTREKGKNEWTKYVLTRSTDSDHEGQKLNRYLVNVLKIPFSLVQKCIRLKKIRLEKPSLSIVMNHDKKNCSCAKLANGKETLNLSDVIWFPSSIVNDTIKFRMRMIEKAVSALGIEKKYNNEVGNQSSYPTTTKKGDQTKNYHHLPNNKTDESIKEDPNFCPPYKRRHESFISSHMKNQILKSIIYMDKNIIVLNKPYGLSVQTGKGDNLSESLSTYLPFLTFEKKDLDVLPRPCHRLDKYTTGILVLGRSRIATTFILNKFSSSSYFYQELASFTNILKKKNENEANCQDDEKSHSLSNKLSKHYIAILNGIPRSNEGLIKTLIRRVSGENEMELMQSFSIVNDDLASTIPFPRKEIAITKYVVLERNIKSNKSLVLLQPLTGRTHQLRVHCTQVLGAPILGDRKYACVASPTANLNFCQKKTDASSVSNNEDDHLISHLHLHCYKIIIPDYFTFNSQHLTCTETSDLSSLKSNDLSLKAPLPVEFYSAISRHFPNKKSSF